MFARRYFAAIYWAPHYFPSGGSGAPEPPPSPSRARGGRIRFVDSRRKEEKLPPPRPKRKRREVPEAAPLADVAFDLPLVAPASIDPEMWQRVLTAVRVRERAQRKAETEAPAQKLSVEERLLQHFIEMLGEVPLPEIDEDDAPFMLMRFLRMGR
jgi:hypothetical protein